MSMSVASIMEVFLLLLLLMSSINQKLDPTSWSGNILFSRTNTCSLEHRKQSLAKHVYVNY